MRAKSEGGRGGGFGTEAQFPNAPLPHSGLPFRETADNSERSRGRSLLHGQDMGKTQDHRNSVERWVAAVGGWRLVAVGGGWRLAVGGPWGLSFRAVLNEKKGGLRIALRIALPHHLWQPSAPGHLARIPRGNSHLADAGWPPGLVEYMGRRHPRWQRHQRIVVDSGAWKLHRGSVGPSTQSGQCILPSK